MNSIIPGALALFAAAIAARNDPAHESFAFVTWYVTAACATLGIGPTTASTPNTATANNAATIQA